MWRVLGWLVLISLLYVAGVGVVSVNITIVCGGCWGVLISLLYVGCWGGYC